MHLLTVRSIPNQPWKLNLGDLNLAIGSSRVALRVTRIDNRESFSVQKEINLNVPDPEVVLEAEQQRIIKRLQESVNFFIRWYRFVSHKTDVSELSLYAMSPFTFEITPETRHFVHEPISWRKFAPRVHPLIPDLSIQDIQARLAEGNEPPVADLFLLDAAQAIDEGRFREAVLFSWAVIDSVFNQGYARLLDTRLKGDLTEGIDELKDPRGGGLRLKTRMTVMMSLLANSSLKHESFWEDLSASYSKRNKIIHDGDVANQEDGQRAYEVARSVQVFMRTVEAESR